MVTLSASERAALPQTLPLWHVPADRDALVREIVFADFSAAWGAMSRIALLAERLNHHPEWSNSYNRLRIVLTSHDVGGLSSRDLTMARAIDAVLEAPRPG